MTTDLELAMARRVVSALEERGHTVPWLAEASGIPLPRLEDLLYLRSGFTVTDLGDIAAALGVPVAALVPPSAAPRERPEDQLGLLSDV
jgi:hypothetical protein